MAEISAASVKELREKTGAGMMDCKKALAEAGGDMDAAVDWLRKKGLSAAAKKAGRTAAEGLVAVTAQGTKGTAVEVNAETDFVGRNEQFQNYVRNVGEIAHKTGGDIEKLKSQAYPGTGRNVQEELTQLIATVGENMNLRRTQQLSVNEGVVVSYTHNAVTPNLGKIGVLVALESKADAGKLSDLGRKIAMHVAAARPEALSIENVDPAALEREKAILADQAKQTGKPPEIVAKMMEGRVKKYYEDVVLLEQAFVMEPDLRIKQVIEKASKELGAPVKLAGFVRFQLGEGIEKEEADFAAEVAKMAS
ncbi:MAG TPA: translation elongation factor Ts [Alphaproteobacteria bacterium]|nr:translation elongation factor Ts [Alphaproteobacteria bacterium]